MLKIKKRGLTTFALAMLITGSIDSIRNLPAAALFGNSLIFYYVLAAVIFLIPSALISAELTANSRNESGIYYWVKNAFGENLAFLAIWLQWVANLVWFPTILSFIAGLLAYLIDPALAQNKYYLVTVILMTFWGITLINFRGITLSTRLTSICTMLGMLIPVVIIISMAFIWVLQGHGSHLHLSFTNVIPHFSDSNTWVSLTAIMAGFVGMEVTAVHIKDTHEPQITFPRALFISVWIILATMLLGSISIGVILPVDQIKVVNGVMQTITTVFHYYKLGWLIPVMTLLILLGSIGGIINWVISPAKGILQAGQSGFLPDFFLQENKHGVATNLLITQACIVSVICFLFLEMPTVGGTYWILTALNTQLYMLMYIMLFLTGIYSRFNFPSKEKLFRVPGGKIGIYFVTVSGLVGCTITLFIGFFPPDKINVGDHSHYAYLLLTGLVMSILPILLFYFYKNAFCKPVLEV